MNTKNDPDNYRAHNRRAWNEIAAVRSQMFPPAEFFAQGGSTLTPRAVAAAQAALGALGGQEVIHLQCATGEDTLSWAGLGLAAYGVDISEVQIELARAKAQAAGLNARFTAADVYALPEALPGDWPAQYDLVFSGGGALVWLPDIWRWAEIAAGLVRPGGKLLLEEIHPISGVLWVENGELQVAADYFGRDRTQADRGWGHFKGGEDAHETKYEFNWPLGDIVTALIRAGLTLERLEEFPGGPAYRFKERVEESLRLPGDFILLARK